MTNDRLIHDVSYAAAMSIVDSFGACFRDEEKRDVFEVAYTTVKASIEAYEVQVNRMERRLRPGKN